ncbi:unnamed protein product [Pelagomonas calceolata]|uniref:Protein kinase domain-containing protein n=1 Tax=Pelagomonas calceolata TaxID=35677 RepID=A0A8J2X3T5_9STRA|nr:unnamed protein product [Pelagomonas calceolata]|mmetsp:Transcript_591/g.1618  ORF Transcript_591/g.1618 Transcript_591/m.1618 type:complete len:433 (+) Transcript_591:153-1451(+)
MSNILKKILPRALQATGSPTDLESTWAQQEALPPSVAADKLLTETCVGPYEVLRRLGDGEFSTVVECRKADNPETYALKVIGKAKVQRHSSILKSKRNISRVNREVRAMRAANHAGICRLFDVMQTPSHIYLVLEKGDRDLYALIDDYPGGCPENVVKSATRILVLALRHCHNAKIAHRDIKPENILVCGDPHTWHQNPDAGIVKLCDFGLCADIPEDGALLQDFVGSPGFFAPELLQRPAYDGARADLFSLGAVMVELIFGHDFFGAVWYPAYEDLLKVDRFAAAIADAVARVRCGSNERPPLEPPLQALLNGLLEVVPERRKTVEELCHEEWFELMRGGPDQASLLRLTFDHSRPSAGEKPAKHRARSKAQTLRGSSAALAAAAAAPAPADAAKPPFVRKVTPPPDAILEAAPPPREGRVVSPQPRGSLG